MKRAEILTPWTGTGERIVNPYRPLLGDEYTLVETRDTTDQPSTNLYPDPNLYSLEVVCEDAVLAAIESDPTYLVLCSEDI